MSADVTQSALNPAGAEAAHIAHLWWIFFWVTLSIFALVAIALLIAIGRQARRGAGELEIIGEPDAQTQKRTAIVVWTFVGVTVAILFALLISDFFTGNAIYAA